MGVYETGIIHVDDLGASKLQKLHNLLNNRLNNSKQSAIYVNTMKQKQLQCNKQNRPVDLNEESLMGLGKNILSKCHVGWYHLCSLSEIKYLTGNLRFAGEDA